MEREILHSDKITENHMKKLLAVIISGLGLAALPSIPAGAQSRNHFAIEATPIHGTLSYARGPESDVRAGVEVGFGFPQIDLSLAPKGHEFTQIAHVGVFGRFAAARA